MSKCENHRHDKSMRNETYKTGSQRCKAIKRISQERKKMSRDKRDTERGRERWKERERERERGSQEDE